LTKKQVSGINEMIVKITLEDGIAEG